eukprot:15189226-Ditylum_brightwellii.AAC.1
METNEVPYPLEDTRNRREEQDSMSASSRGPATDPPLPLLTLCANWDSLDALDMLIKATTDC